MVKQLVWDEEAHWTGFKDIDIQHKKLFDFINQLGEVIKANKAHEMIEESLDFLDYYIKNYFGMEEMCMAANKCPFATKNCDAHTKFVKAYEDFSARFKNSTDNMSLVQEMHTMLVNWTDNHIRRIDTGLRECFTHLEFGCEDGND